MDVMSKIKEVTETLDSIDNYFSGLDQELSDCDSRIQDLLHYAENNKISILWAYKYANEIRKVMTERRRVKNDMELLCKFNEQKNKLISSENRKFMVAEVCKREKQLNMPYKNKRYTDEDFEKLFKKSNKKD